MTSWADFIFGSSVGALIAIVGWDITMGWPVGAFWAFIGLLAVVTLNVSVRVWASNHTPARRYPEG